MDRVIARPAAGQPAQGKAGEIRGPDGVADPACRELPYPVRPACQHVQLTVDVDDLDQLRGTEFGQQVRGAERGSAGHGAAVSPHRAGAHRALQPVTFPLQRRVLPALAARLLQLPGHPAQRGQVGVELGVGQRPYRGDGVGGGPPAFAPGQQQPRAAGPGGMALGERGQFGAVHGGLRAQFGCAQGEPVLVEDVKAAAARGQHPARAGRRVGAQRLAEPAADPRQRRTAPSAPGRRQQMTIGRGAAPEVQGDPPGQQMCLRRVGRTQGVQPGGRLIGLAQQPGRDRARCIACLDEQPRRMGLPPGTLQRPEQAVGTQRPVLGGRGLGRGQRAVGGHQQQFGLLGIAAALFVRLPDRVVRLGQRVGGQPGRQQDGAPVDAQVYGRHLQPPVTRVTASR